MLLSKYCGLMVRGNAIINFESTPKSQGTVKIANSVGTGQALSLHYQISLQS